MYSLSSPIQQYNPGAYQVQQSQFSSPPVLYSQSQPMLVSNQNNMNYQMVNLGAGAIMQKMQQRQQEEQLIDMLTRQNQIVNEIVEDFDQRMRAKQLEREEELEELERYQILLKQKKAEQEYIYKINRQLTHGLQRIREQQLKRIEYPNKPKMLAMKIPSIIKLEKIEGIYPNPRIAKSKISFKSTTLHHDDLLDQEIQVEPEYQYENPYAPYQYDASYDNYRQQGPPRDYYNAQPQTEQMSRKQTSQRQSESQRTIQTSMPQTAKQLDMVTTHHSAKPLDTPMKPPSHTQTVRSKHSEKQQTQQINTQKQPTPYDSQEDQDEDRDSEMVEV